MQINDSLQLWDSDIVGLLKGERARRALSASQVAPEQLSWKQSARDRKIQYAFEVRFQVLNRVVSAQGATETRTSKALGISLATLAHLTSSLWKRTFSEERDRRAGADANAQKRGQVSRAMQAELASSIKEALDGHRK